VTDANRLSRILALGALLAAHGAPVAAQRGLGPEQQDIRDLSGDVWSVWTSPGRIRANDLIPSALAMATIGVTARFDSATHAWMSDHDGSGVMIMLSPAREHSRITAYELGSGFYLLPISGGLYVVGRLSHSEGLRDAGLGCAAGHLSSLGIRLVSYHVLGRERPEVTPQPYHFSVPGSANWLWHSFFSGHIANSMACASYLGHRFNLGVVEPIPYAYSAAIGLGRMADGAHWASDTMVGAVVGFAIGKAIADRQLQRNAARSAPVNPTSTARMSWSLPVSLWSFKF
jgi:hypothetical protein